MIQSEPRIENIDDKKTTNTNVNNRKELSGFRSSDIDIFLTTRDPDKAFDTIIALYKKVRKTIPSDITLTVIRLNIQLLLIYQNLTKKYKLLLVYIIRFSMYCSDSILTVVASPLMVRKFIPRIVDFRSIKYGYNLVDTTNFSTS